MRLNLSFVDAVSMALVVTCGLLWMIHILQFTRLVLASPSGMPRAFAIDISFAAFLSVGTAVWFLVSRVIR